MNLKKPLSILILMLLCGLGGLVVSNTKVKKYIQNNVFESLVLGVCVMVVLILLFTNKDNFEGSGKCCPPTGISPVINSECDSGVTEECTDESGATHTVGKMVGSYRCMGDGSSYKC